MHKNLLIFCDDGEDPYCPSIIRSDNKTETIPDSNIIHLYDAVRISTNTNTMYLSGKRNYSGFLRVNIPLYPLENQFDKDMIYQISKAYHFLSSNHTPEYKIFLFGYSRGAYIVRILSNLIGNVGLRDKFPDAWEKFMNGDKAPERELLEVDIRFVVVWNMPKAVRGGPDISSITGTELPKTVGCALHALPYHGTKKESLFLWTKSDNSSTQKLEQVWFPGDHTDICRGYPGDQVMTDLTLFWAAGELISDGNIMLGLRELEEIAVDNPDVLPVGWRDINHYNDYQSRSRFSSINCFVRSSPARAISDGSKVHESLALLCGTLLSQGYPVARLNESEKKFKNSIPPTKTMIDGDKPSYGYSYVRNLLLAICRLLPSAVNVAYYFGEILGSGIPIMMTKVPTSWLSITENFSDFNIEEKLLHRNGENLVLSLSKKLLSESSTFVVDDISKWMDRYSWKLRGGSAQDGRVCFEFSANRGRNLFIGKQFILVRSLTDDSKSRGQTIRDEYKSVLRELHIWSELRNRQDKNIVTMEFISFLPKNCITTISRKLPTNLREAFNNPKYFEINYIAIIQGIANGLQFLHAFQQSSPTGENGEEEKISHIIHGDIKCANVLLGVHENNLTPYLTDFGFSHELIEGSFTKVLDTTGVPPLTTLPWMAPELVNKLVATFPRMATEPVQHQTDKISYTREADVWSFGMTIYEIVTQNDPWFTITEGMGENDACNAVKQELSSERYPPWPNTLPDALQPCSTNLQELFHDCCRYGERHTMDELVEALTRLPNRYLPFPPNHSTTPIVKSWLSKEAIDNFIGRGSMATYEKDLHLAGESLLLKLVNERLLQNRVDQDDFIINIDERMIKDSSLHISSSTDRNVFEFLMLDRNKNKRSYVGKKFTLVRGRRDERDEDRKRNISDGYKRVLRELHIWNKLRESSNFVQLLHISFDDGKSITAVFEKFHRDLRHSLSTLGIDLVTIIKGIAKGLEFLHKFTEEILINGLENQTSSSSEKIRKIVHGEVKCANVFLREGSNTPYLTNFGDSHQLIQGTFTKMYENSSAYATGTLPWMPLELLLAPDKKSESEPKVSFTSESDVWSFGMTIHEIVSENDPWAQDATKGLVEPVDIQGKIMKAMENELLPDWPSNIPLPLYKYADSLCDLRNRCCKHAPSERLTMEKVVDELDKIFVHFANRFDIAH